MSEILFDFNDGNGPVPAHKHSKGGGWVADTALVYGDARVYGKALVSPHHARGRAVRLRSSGLPRHHRKTARAHRREGDG